MGPAIDQDGTKRNRRRKSFPSVGEMVRLGDRRGLFLVMRIDPHQQVADLRYRVGKNDELETDVSLSLIRSVPREAARAIQGFLRS